MRERIEVFFPNQNDQEKTPRYPYAKELSWTLILLHILKLIENGSYTQM
jgi:hypothetical protein